jgi:hypothetical protein
MKEQDHEQDVYERANRRYLHQNREQHFGRRQLSESGHD